MSYTTYTLCIQPLLLHNHSHVDDFKWLIKYINIAVLFNCIFPKIWFCILTITLHIEHIEHIETDAKKKMRLCKKIPIEFPEFFLSKSWSNRLDCSYGSFSQVMQQFFSGLLKPISPMYYFLTGTHRSWVLTTNHLLKMVQNFSMSSMFDGFWMILLPWDTRNTICHALIGYFIVRIWGWFSVVTDFFTIFVFFEIFVSNIFENISKLVDFLEKAMKTCFVANVPSFQENFEL